MSRQARPGASGRRDMHATWCCKCLSKLDENSDGRINYPPVLRVGRHAQHFARMIERAGIEAKFGFKPHPHMLRHACGYSIANRGHDTRALQAYLGHKNIQRTVRYTELSPTRFKNFWRE